MLAHSLRRCREWCRCSDDSWPKRLRLRVETVGWKRRRALTEAANTSARRNDEDACLPPCKPHPSPHRRVSPGPGSEKEPDRNKVAIRSFSVVAYSSVCLIASVISSLAWMYSSCEVEALPAPSRR